MVKSFYLVKAWIASIMEKYVSKKSVNNKI